MRLPSGRLNHFEPLRESISGAWRGVLVLTIPNALSGSPVLTVDRILSRWCRCDRTLTHISRRQVDVLRFRRARSAASAGALAGPHRTFRWWA